MKQKMRLSNGAANQQSTDMESTAVEAITKPGNELPKKKDAAVTNVTEPANALNVQLYNNASGQLDVG